LDDKVQNSQSTAMMKSRCRRKNHQIRQFLAPCFAGPQIFDVHVKVWLTYEHVTKFGWVLCVDLRGRRSRQNMHTRGRP